MIGLVWIVLILVLMGFVLGWGYFVYNLSIFLCGVVYLRMILERFYLLFFVLVVYVIIFLIMMIVYIRIFFVVCKYMNRIVKYISGGFEVMRF